jgi:steroid delta-isomerase-like uncharacterized protein
MGTIVSGRGVAHAWIDSWNRHDSAAVAANLTEQGTYADPATGGPQGRGDLAAYAEVYFEAFPDLRFEIVRIVDGGGAVVVQWVVRGTFTGRLGELQPNGALITVPGVDVVVVDGDHIVSVEAYWDQLAFHEQVAREEEG